MFKQLHKKVMEYWSEDSKTTKVINNIFKSLKISANCRSIYVPFFSEI